MIVVRAVVQPDPAVRANLVAALTGPSAPAGVCGCSVRGDVVSVTFDDAVVAAGRIDDAIVIATHFVGAGELTPAAAEERLAAVGLGGPPVAPGDARSRERAAVGLD